MYFFCLRNCLKLGKRIRIAVEGGCVVFNGSEVEVEVKVQEEMFSSSSSSSSSLPFCVKCPSQPKRR